MRKYKDYIDITVDITFENISKDLDVIIKDIQDSKFKKDNSKALDDVIVKLQELKDGLN